MKRNLVIHSSPHTDSVWVPHVRTSVRGSTKTGRSPIKALSFSLFVTTKIGCNISSQRASWVHQRHDSPQEIREARRKDLLLLQNRNEQGDPKPEGTTFSTCAVKPMRFGRPGPHRLITRRFSHGRICNHQPLSRLIVRILSHHR